VRQIEFLRALVILGAYGVVMALIILSVGRPTNFKGASLPVRDLSQELDWRT
jgi:hypothetical protein